jgi:hypothetical protein
MVMIIANQTLDPEQISPDDRSIDPVDAKAAPARHREGKLPKA